jgi:hypothetical protein
LTVQRLPRLVPIAIRPDITNRVQALLTRTAFARDWRNQHIAHNDLLLALDLGATPLSPASRRDVRESLQAIDDLLNAVEGHYFQSETRFDYDWMTGGLDNAETLLQVLGEWDASRKGSEAGA